MSDKLQLSWYLVVVTCIFGLTAIAVAVESQHLVTVCKQSRAVEHPKDANLCRD